MPESMQTTERSEHARSLFAGIAADYDRWAYLLSFGQDTRWHDRLVEWIAPAASVPGATVVDVATGTAAVAIAIARRYPCRVIGVDQSPEMLERAAERIRAAGLEQRIELVEARAEELPLEPGSADALVHTYLLRYVEDPGETLATLAAAVRPGGIMASLEFGRPAGVSRRLWQAYTRLGLPAAGAVAGPGWLATGRFLGRSIEQFDDEYPLPRLLELWRAAGMERIAAQRMSLGGGVLIRGRRPETPQEDAAP
jgi:demethylmenaquinone methyltransferase/2-methoxy-6-polyprenyl-1,4-benzoquinol methylase